MVLVKCSGCRKKYENGRSISAHQRKCSGVNAKAKALFKKRDKSQKEKEIAKIPCQEYSQDNDNVHEQRADVRERINSFDTDETHGRKRKLAGLHIVSDCIMSQQGYECLLGKLLAPGCSYAGTSAPILDNSYSPAIPRPIASSASLYSGCRRSWSRTWFSSTIRFSWEGIWGCVSIRARQLRSLSWICFGETHNYTRLPLLHIRRFRHFISHFGSICYSILFRYRLGFS